MRCLLCLKFFGSFLKKLWHTPPLPMSFNNNVRREEIFYTAERFVQSENTAEFVCPPLQCFMEAANKAVGFPNHPRPLLRASRRWPVEMAH